MQALSTVILEPKKIKSATVSIFFTSICHKVMGPDAMISVFWMLSFKPAFSLLSPSSRGSDFYLFSAPSPESCRLQPLFPQFKKKEREREIKGICDPDTPNYKWILWESMTFQSLTHLDSHPHCSIQKLCHLGQDYFNFLSGRGIIIIS